MPQRVGNPPRSQPALWLNKLPDDDHMTGTSETHQSDAAATSHEVNRSRTAAGRLLEQFEPFGRVAALMIGAVYVLGFFIVALHQSAFGIAQLEPFKPRIIGAGASFIFLSVVAVVTTFRQFGSLTQFGGPSSGEPVAKTWDRVLAIAGMYPVIYGASIPLGAVFLVHEESPQHSLDWLPAVFFAVWFFALLFAQYKRRSWPKTSQAVAVGTSMFVFVSQAIFGNRGVFFLSLWFLIAGVGAVVIGWALRRNPRDLLMKDQWETQIPMLVAIFILYANHVYSRMKPEFGGGAPVPAVLELKQQLKAFKVTEPSVLLLEETDKGYYVLRTSSDKSAVFVSRDLVSTVSFGKP